MSLNATRVLDHVPKLLRELNSLKGIELSIYELESKENLLCRPGFLERKPWSLTWGLKSLSGWDQLWWILLWLWRRLHSPCLLRLCNLVVLNLLISNQTGPFQLLDSRIWGLFLRSSIGVATNFFA